MTNIFYKVQENFLPRYFKNFLAAVLLALPDIFQQCDLGQDVLLTSGLEITFPIMVIGNHDFLPIKKNLAD